MVLRGSILSSGKWRAGLLCVVLFLCLWPGLSDHVSVEWGMRYFWLLLLPVIIRVREPGNFSLRYLFVLAPLFALAFWLPHPLFRFGVLFAAIFLVIEAFVGKLDRLAPVFAVLVAPITHYFINTFGFHVRLSISKVVARTLKSIDPEAMDIGNALMYQGQEFHVDPECMGLRMITTSLIVTMALIALRERRLKTSLSEFALPVLLLVTFVLVAVSNYVRILLLVVSAAPAGGFWHEVIGLISWLLFVLLPMIHIVERWDRVRSVASMTKTVWPIWKQRLVTTALLPTMLVGMIHPVVPVEDERDLFAEQLNIPGCERTILPNNVVSFTSDHLQIFMKPGKAFYSNDHHPMSCWIGSGYHFTHEVLEPFRDGTICFGQLSNGASTRYSAWWYDNGSTRTCGQLEWRWLAALGEGPFRLINVTADTPQELMREVSRLYRPLEAEGHLLKGTQMTLM